MSKLIVKCRFKYQVSSLSPNPTRWSNTLKQFAADELIECVSPFFGVGVERVKYQI